MIKSSVSKTDLKLKSPFTALISGQSGSGKTTLLLKIIAKNKDIMSEPPKSILYAYGQYNSSIPNLQKSGIRVHAGIPSDELLDSMPRPMLLLLDDLMIQLNNKRDVLAGFFTRKSHHSNISIVFIVQNLFERNLKIVRDNSHYIFLLNSPSAAQQIRSLGSQIFPGPQLKYFLDSYRQAVTEKKFGYLFLDLHPASDNNLRLRTNIFGETEFPTVYLP
jgi:energy-coupling factor transporter ATP-binding protein EcfA2